MRAKALLLGSIMSVAAVVGTVPASADTLRDFDINKVQGWADAIAICDVTKFLLSQPDLDAEFIIAAAPDVTAGTLQKPYFIPPSNFYSNVMHQMFDSVRKSGQVTMPVYADARFRYTKAMFAAYRHATAADQAFLADQMKLCYAIAVNTRQQVRHPVRASTP